MSTNLHMQKAAKPEPNCFRDSMDVGTFLGVSHQRSGSTPVAIKYGSGAVLVATASLNCLVTAVLGVHRRWYKPQAKRTNWVCGQGIVFIQALTLGLTLRHC